MTRKILFYIPIIIFFQTALNASETAAIKCDETDNETFKFINKVADEISRNDFSHIYNLQEYLFAQYITLEKAFLKALQYHQKQYPNTNMDALTYVYLTIFQESFKYHFPDLLIRLIAMKHNTDLTGLQYNNLGFIFKRGINIKDTGCDLILAIKYYRKGAQKNCKASIVNLALYFYEQQDYHQAIPLLQKDNYPLGLGILMRIYENGYGIEKDLDKAISYMFLFVKFGYYEDALRKAKLYSHQEKVTLKLLMQILNGHPRKSFFDEAKYMLEEIITIKPVTHTSLNRSLQYTNSLGYTQKLIDDLIAETDIKTCQTKKGAQYKDASENQILHEIFTNIGVNIRKLAETLPLLNEQNIFLSCIEPKKALEESSDPTGNPAIESFLFNDQKYYSLGEKAIKNSKKLLVAIECVRSSLISGEKLINYYGQIVQEIENSPYGEKYITPWIKDHFSSLSWVPNNDGSLPTHASIKDTESLKTYLNSALPNNLDRDLEANIDNKEALEVILDYYFAIGSKIAANKFKDDIGTIIKSTESIIKNQSVYRDEQFIKRYGFNSNNSL